MPLHRLDEQPLRRAVLQDLTCDSDGKVTQYVDHQSIESSMPVHDLKPDEEYLIGVFLVGAYQEILGDMHICLATRIQSTSTPRMMVRCASKVWKYTTPSKTCCVMCICSRKT